MRRQMLAILFTFGIVTSLRAESSLEYIRKHAIPIKAPSQINDHVYNHLKDKAIVLLGEVHGTHNAPQYVVGLARLIEKFSESPPIVAVEWTTSLQTSLDKFMQSGDDRIFLQHWFFSQQSQDGRSSEAMIAMLKKLRQKNVKVLAIDPFSQATKSRDQGMAANILEIAKSYPSRKIVVLLGNVHSRLGKGYDQNPDYQPVGYLLKKSLGKKAVLSVKLRYQGGSLWACMGKPMACKTHNQPEVKTAYSRAFVDLDHFFLLDETVVDGHHATLYTRSLLAAKPFALTKK